MTSLRLARTDVERQAKLTVLYVGLLPVFEEEPRIGPLTGSRHRDPLERQKGTVEAHLWRHDQPKGRGADTKQGVMVTPLAIDRGSTTLVL